MKKQRASSKEGFAALEKGFKTVDQAFSYYFPKDKKPLSHAEGRESGAELAERVFQEIVHSSKR